MGKVLKVREQGGHWSLWSVVLVCIREPYLDQLRNHTMGASSVFSGSLPFPSMAITTNPSPEPAGSFDHKLDLSVPGSITVFATLWV